MENAPRVTLGITTKEVKLPNTVCPRKNGLPKYNGVVFEIRSRHHWNFYNRI